MHTSPHSRDLRKGRHSETGGIYLITSTTHQRHPHFTEFHTAREVVHAMRHETHHVETLAFVVMPDHLHWLLRLREQVPLERVVRNVKAFSARRINETTRRCGPIWQSGFHDHALRRERDLVALARYVVANPLRAGLVTRLADYPHWDAAWI